MADTLTGLNINTAFGLTTFVSEVNSSNYRLRKGDGTKLPISVTGNTALFSTTSPELLEPFIPTNYGSIRGANISGSGAAMLVGTNTSAASSSGDRAQFLLSCGSVDFLPAAVAGKASKVHELRKTVTATATTCLDQFQVAGRNNGSSSTEDRIFEASAYTDSTNPANSYKEVKFGGFGNALGNSAQWVFRYNPSLDTGYFHYGTDNKISIGQASNRFTTVYASTGTINTSDARYKTEIQDIPDDVLDAWESVPVKMYKFTDAVASKGNAARWHFGRIAQDVKAAFEAKGLDPFAYGVLCYDEWSDVYEDECVYIEKINDQGEKEYIRQLTGNKILTQKAGNRYSIRYDEAAILDTAIALRSKSIA